MTHRHAVVLLCLVGAVLVAPSILAQETPTATANATNESDTAGMGTQLTAFAQSSSAAANDSVENGMWQARFEQANASQRAQLVTNRAGSLESRLEQLRDQNETIRAEYENGSLPEPAYVAQQSRLSARITALRAAINDTDEAATEAGVNDSRLETLRQNASDLTGPQVAAVARGLGGGPPERAGPPGNRTTGPPEQAGPPGNETPGGPPENRTGGQPNATGPPENGTTGGPPEAGGGSGNGAGAGNTSNGTGDAGRSDTPDGTTGDSAAGGGSSGAGSDSGSGADAGSGSSSGDDSGSSGGAGSSSSSGSDSGASSGSGGGSGSGNGAGSGSGSGSDSGASSGSGGGSGSGSGSGSGGGGNAGGQAGN